MKVSVVIPCFNGEKFVGRAVRSALNQRFPVGELEVVVVDDGSTDHSREVVADCGDVVLIEHAENRGLPAARNTGIRRARGRYVLLVDADDYIHTDLAYVQHLHLALNPHWGAVGCDYYLVDEHEQHISRISGAAHPIACGIMFSRDALVDIGLYDEEMRVWEDEDLRLRFMKRYHIGHVELPLYRYRKHKANLTNDAELAAEYRAKLRAKHAGG
jgi:glycosyltransferase involved in cell wall biosynthesis